MKQYRESVFALMQKNTRFFSARDYEKIYAPAREFWGINSPAVIIPKAFFRKHPFPEELPSDIDAGFMIAVNSESVPDPGFLKYLTEHEYWELYVDEKIGFNLGKHSRTDFRLPVLERRRPGHRYATLKELQAAEKDGKLEEYMQWWRNFYQSDIEYIQKLPQKEVERISQRYNTKGDSRDMIIRRIQKNLALKEDIYTKIVSKRKAPVVSEEKQE